MAGLPRMLRDLGARLNVQVCKGPAGEELAADNFRLILL